MGRYYPVQERMVPCSRCGRLVWRKGRRLWSGDVYCRGACRQAAYRDRKRDAVVAPAPLERNAAP